MKKLLGLAIVFVLMIALFSSLTVSASGEVDEELLAIGPKFEQAFERGDLEAFEALYWHDEGLTVFWPDADSGFRFDGWKQFQGCLQRFLYYISQFPPGTVNMELRQPSIQMMEDVAILTAYWIITIPMPDGTMEVMQGRTTLVCKKIEGKWLIIHEHESIFPTS